MVLINERINNIQQQFFSVLDDFEKYYVFTNKNPEVDEYQNYYMNSKTQLQNLSLTLMKLTNTIENSITELNDKSIFYTEQLEDLKKKKEMLDDLLNNLDSTDNSSKELINDTKELYNYQYYKNVELFIGIIIVSFLLRVLFKKSS